MLDLLLVPVAILYLMTVGLMFIYGVNFFYLTWIAVRNRDYLPELRAWDEWPCVTVQLPVYNEMYVAERLVDAAANLDYPRDRLEIQVLDDSRDETTAILEEKVDGLRRQGVNIALLHRVDRTGYKAGALAEGLMQAHGEFIAIFDADFVPRPGFLKHALPYFNHPRVGFVQTRWTHINADFSVLTYLQSLAIDAHFMVEQFGRACGGFWFNFNGTAGIWRKETMLDAGGWRADTLTEDLDLSYRMFFRGWQARYVRDIAVPAELPVSFSAYRRQQHRWARGSLECAIRYLPRIWASELSLGVRLQATLHLTGYGVHLLLFTLALLYPLVIMLSVQYAQLVSLFGIAFLFNATALAPTVFFITAQQALGVNWKMRLPLLLFISAFGSGMMLNTVRAGVGILTSRRATFERTPKFGIVKRDQPWSANRYQLRLDWIVLAELVFLALNIETVILAMRQNNWAIAIYAGIFAMGLTFTAGTSLQQAFAAHLAASGRDHEGLRSRKQPGE